MTVNAATAQKFEKILNLENDVRWTRIVIVDGNSFCDRSRAADRLPLIKARLSAMIDALSPEEMKQFGEYRKQVLAEIAAAE